MSKKQNKLKELREKIELVIPNIDSDTLAAFEQIRKQRDADGGIKFAAWGVLILGIFNVFLGTNTPTGWPFIVAGIFLAGIGVWNLSGKPSIGKIQTIGTAFGAYGLLLSIGGFVLVAHLFLTRQEGGWGAVIVMIIGAGFMNIGDSTYRGARKTLDDLNQESIPTHSRELYFNIANYLRGVDAVSTDDVIQVSELQNYHLQDKAWLIGDIAIVGIFDFSVVTREIFQIQEKGQAKKKLLLASYTIDGVKWSDVAIDPGDFEIYKIWKSR